MNDVFKILSLIASIDVDKDGKLSRDELIEGVIRYYLTDRGVDSNDLDAFLRVLRLLLG